MKGDFNITGFEGFGASFDREWPAVDVSVVIPVYNGVETIGRVVHEVFACLQGVRLEVVLVNDGSVDDSERVCFELAQRHPGKVVFLQLTRNFGEHNAVMAGLKYAGGEYVAVLDDDGQHAAADVVRMLEHARREHLDVVYGRYQDRQHPPLRVLGSWFNDRIANLILRKPRGLYLSSFKVMSRLVVDEICRYAGPSPYIDGLILRVTKNVGQINVQHRPRAAGRSGYTPSRLVGLWMNMFMGFSFTPVRVLTALGMLGTLIGSIALAALLFWRFVLDSQAITGTELLASGMTLVAGAQLLAMGIVGEHVVRAYLHQSGAPQSVLRYVSRGDESAASSRLRSHNGRGNSMKYTVG